MSLPPQLSHLVNSFSSDEQPALPAFLPAARSRGSHGCVRARHFAPL